METVTIIGVLAGIASTASFTPQAWKIVKSRRTADISVGMYILTVSGFTLWTTYGILKGAWPIIVPNAICLCFAAFILMMKLLPRQEKEKVADLLDPEARS
jgi:MtN3 and saliva related transmembrane protein